MMQAPAPFRLLVVFWALILFPTVIHAANGLGRTVLPVPKPRYPPIKESDARKAKPPPDDHTVGGGPAAEWVQHCGLWEIP